jgi:hypothetical protein
MAELTLVIRPSAHVVDLDGVECRLWFGVDEDGALYEVWVHRVCTRDPNADRKLQQALFAKGHPASLTDEAIERLEKGG